MSDSYIVLNPGVGGEVIDDSAVTYGSAPTTRKRQRVVLCGEGQTEIASIVDSNPAGTEYGMVTRPIVSSYPGDLITEFDSVTLVPSGIETTVVSYTVPFGKTFYLIGVVGSGNTNALFKFYSESTPILAGRTSVANLTFSLNYSLSPLAVVAGDTVYLKVTQQSGTSCDFEGTVLGYNV